MEKELIELYEAVKKSADAASSVDDKPEETRCIEALQQLKKFPVNYQILVSTQVGKHLKLLTKHPRRKIRAFASDLIEIWKEIIMKEVYNNKNGKPDNGETATAGKLQKSTSVKLEKVVVKAETTKVEKTVRNCTSISEDSKKLVQKTDSASKDNKQASGVKKTAPSPTAPPKLKTMLKSNDSTRDKIREILLEALSKVSEEADEEIIDRVHTSDPIRVAVTVESVLFQKWGSSVGTQKAKYRSLMFNLKDKNNPDFRRKVLLGEIEAEKLINMNAVEMASDQRKKEVDEMKKKALFECERSERPKATTDQFKCGKCGERQCTYSQMQTRSADEPMTTFVACTFCGSFPSSSPIIASLSKHSNNSTTSFLSPHLCLNLPISSSSSNSLSNSASIPQLAHPTTTTISSFSFLISFTKLHECLFTFNLQGIKGRNGVRVILAHSRTEQEAITLKHQPHFLGREDEELPFPLLQTAAAAGQPIAVADFLRIPGLAVKKIRVRILDLADCVNLASITDYQCSIFCGYCV
ncbi:transcription elongation factor TFIIS [Senna tora]|uniref:Transcription elongation factor TFIIS n=1 Tax=Senna tora TaxID=362788 RepID=A0A834TYT7_9FABA|nr:transcription elongation factor TFIIS [Senna tora]